MNRNDRRRLAKTHPPDESAALQAAFRLQQSGQIAAAAQAYQAILRRDAGNPEAMRLLGEALSDLGRPAEAISLLRRFASQYPDHFVSHYSLGNAYRLAGQPAPAADSFRAALARNQNFAGAYHGLGAVLRQLERDDEAAKNFAQATKLAPDFAPAWADLGTTLAALGDFAGAEAALRRSLTLNPNQAELRRYLAALRPPDIAGLQAMLADPKSQEAEKMELGFALGRGFDKQGDHAAAYAQYAQANARLRAMQHAAGQGFDPARLIRDVDTIIATFSPEFFSARSGWGNQAEIFSFIVGMPRAGSTLVEQILASHPQVFGAGEVKAIGAVAQRLRGPASWTQAGIAAGAAKYMAALAPRAGDAARVTDKMLDNIFLLGLIAVLFPHARVIFCERDPLDTCWSCFTQRFAEPYGFDTDLADCALRYKQIARLAAHWRATLPLRMITVNYEQLVADIEPESRRLTDFLGLDWDPACLNFHETRRSIKTASWSQVRRPAFRDSIGRAAPYAAFLAPLIEGLREDRAS
jgi:tetratricopeptide (TPR) repeat protein